MAAPSKARRGRLCQPELATDAPDVVLQMLAGSEDQFVAGLRIAHRALRIEFDLVAGAASPARNPFDLRAHPLVLDEESFVLEPLHPSARITSDALMDHVTSP